MFAFILFLEGILTFISPCILPLMPVYLSYFLRVDTEDKTQHLSLKKMLAFILGFSSIFVLMGILAGSLTQYLTMYQSIIQLIAGIFIILAGINLLGLYRLPYFSLQKYLPQVNINSHKAKFLPLFLFGAIFALGWSPCMSIFLGTALLIASQSQSMLLGGGLLLIYSLGIALPFLITTYFLESLKDSIQWIKKHYNTINIISGILLIIVGILMATGWINYLQLFVRRS